MQGYAKHGDCVQGFAEVGEIIQKINMLTNSVMFHLRRKHIVAILQ